MVPCSVPWSPTPHEGDFPKLGDTFLGDTRVILAYYRDVIGHLSFPKLGVLFWGSLYQGLYWFGVYIRVPLCWETTIHCPGLHDGTIHEDEDQEKCS